MKKIFMYFIMLFFFMFIVSCRPESSTPEFIETPNLDCYSCFAWYPNGDALHGYTLWTATTNTGNCSASTPIPEEYNCDTTKYDCAHPSDYSIMKDYCN